MSQCSVEKFKLFWENLRNRKRTEIEDPKLGRKRNTKEFFGKQVGSAYYPETPEQKYKDAYNNAYDYAITQIKGCFKPPDCQVYATMESILLGSMRGDAEDIEGLFSKESMFRYPGPLQ